MSRMRKMQPDILKTVGGDSFPVNYFFNKNWQQCKLAAVSIFRISLINLPTDAFVRNMSFFEFIFLKILAGWGGVALNQKSDTFFNKKQQTAKNWAMK